MQHHTYEVSRSHYDKELPTLKMNATCWLAQESGDQLHAEEIPDAVREKRRLRDLEDARIAGGSARRTLEEAAERRNPVTKRTKQWNLKPNERQMFQRVLNDPKHTEIAAALLCDRFFMSGSKGKHIMVAFPTNL